MVKTYRQLIDTWPGTTRGIADDLGVGIETAKQFRKRDCIPYRYWRRLIAKGQDHGLSWLTAELLVEIAAERFDRTAA